MKLPRYIALFTLTFTLFAKAQQTGNASVKSALKYYLSPDSVLYFQTTFLNQVWLRYNQSNPATVLFNKPAGQTFDIGLRRTRVQMFGQVSPRTFIYFQFGQNNFNNTAAYNSTPSNRKIAAFFHDALCEFKLSRANQLKIGAGLTVMNGLSRFSQPSIGTSMSLDVPVFLQYSVDQIDQFDRRLALYARGQIKKLDYRIYLANPFPVVTSANGVFTLSANASFVNTQAFEQGRGPGIHNQMGAMVAYNFFETEPHTTPYMTGTYLGSKKILNISLGAVYQQKATWRGVNFNNSLNHFMDTVYEDMVHAGFEILLDMPINKINNTVLNAFAGYYYTDYGKNYLRYNGLMNPATASTATNTIQSGAYGNAYPMFGSGHNVYLQCGYLLPKTWLSEKNGRLMPYFSARYSDYRALGNKAMVLWNTGLNWFIKGHHSKISIELENRPTFYRNQNRVEYGPRKNAVIMQYQVFI